MSPGLLAGVTVLEVGDGLPVGYAGRVMRCLGADVVKLEDAHEPDWLRTYGAGCDAHVGACSWWHVNGAKHRAALDAEAYSRAPALARLIGAANITLVGEGPLAASVEDALALPEAVNASVVRIVPTVDAVSLPSLAANESAGAATGLRDLYGAGHPPEGLRFDLAEVNAGAHAAATACLALARAHVDPEPIRIDVGVYESAFSIIEIAAQTLLLSQQFDSASPDMVGSPLADAYRCADGRAVVINIYGRGVWERTCAALERPDLADDARFTETFTRYQFAHELKELLDGFCARYARDDVIARLWAQRIPSAPVLEPAELRHNEQVVARGIITGCRIASPFLINGERDLLPPPSRGVMEAGVSRLAGAAFRTHYREDLDAVHIELS